MITFGVIMSEPHEVKLIIDIFHILQLPYK